MIFHIINWPTFVYLLVDPGFLSSPPLNFYEASVPLPHPTLQDDAPGRHNGQMDKQTDGQKKNGRVSLPLCV